MGRDHPLKGTWQEIVLKRINEGISENRVGRNKLRPIAIALAFSPTQVPRGQSVAAFLLLA